MRIGFVELLLILLIASLTIGPSAALWVDRWLRRANRASAAAARRRAVQEAQRAAEREEVLQRFQKLSIVFTLAAVAALVWALVLRPIEAPPKTYTAPDHRQASGAAQATLSTDRREIWDLGGYQGVDCIRTRDGLVYAAAWNGSSLKKRTSDLVRTDGGNAAVILSVEGELTGFAFDAAGDLWLTVLTPAGGTLCRARHDSWGASVEQVVTQIDGAPLGALSAVEVGADGKVYFAVVGQESAEQGLESALRTELLAHTGTGAVYVYSRCPHRGAGGGRHCRSVRPCAGQAHPDPLHLRPRQSLHLERCGLCPQPDRRGQGLSGQLQRAAGLSRRAGAG